MPLTGCTIQTIYPYDNPNDGRVKINQNFECLSNNISGSGSGSTSNSGNRWYIPSGETVNIGPTYQGFLYGDLIIDGTINLEINSQLVVVNGDIIVTGGTITGVGTIYALDLPTFDTYVTGGTYSNGTAVFADNVGDTFEVTGFTSFDTYVTGGTYSNGTAIFTDNTGDTFEVTGFTNYYTTGATLNDTTLSFNRTDALSAYSVDLSSLIVPINYSNVIFVDLINGDNATGLLNRFDKPFQNIPQAMSAAVALSGISIDNRALVYIRRGNYVSPVINLQNNVDIYCEPGVVFTGSPNIRDNGLTVSANIYGSLKIYTTFGTQPPFNITGPSVITFEFDWISSNAAAIQIFPTAPGGRVTIKGNYIYSATLGQGFAITIRNNVNVVMNIANSIEAVHQLFRFRFFSGTAVINCPNINLLTGNVYGGNWKQILYIDEVSSSGSIVVNGNMYDKDNTFYGGLSALVRLWTSPAINLTINGDIISVWNAALALGTGSSKITYAGKITTTREAIYVDGSTQVNVKNSTIIRTTDTVASPITVIGSGLLYLNDSTIYSSFVDANIINIESNTARLYIKGVTAEGVGFNYFINTGLATPTAGIINTASNKPNSPGFVNAYTIAGSFSVDSAINTPKF
jgi:hypothetical protein